MNVMCDYCGTMVDDSNAVCPHCGAPIKGVNRMANGVPKTIEELQQWYVARHLPPENVTRFFIGKDIREARAFGIYRDDYGDFIVYKNKSDGERAIRYQGRDEAYAVNELYQKLKAEIANQKMVNQKNTYPEGTYLSSMNQGNAIQSGAFHGTEYQVNELKKAQSSAASTNNNNPKGKRAPVSFATKIVGAILALLGLSCLAPVFMLVLSLIFSPIVNILVPDGYYQYQGKEYYYQNSNWYSYNEYEEEWYDISDSNVPSELGGIRRSEYKTGSHESPAFEDSEWYRPSSSSSSSSSYYSSSSYDDDSWDSSSDWDSGSNWDSGSTDWDSDW